MVLGAIVIVFAGAGIGVVAWVARDSDDTREKLNDRYVEHVEPRGEDHGWLTCSEDPKPTLEKD